MISKVLLCLAVLASASITGESLRCYVCSDCDDDNHYKATTCMDTQDTCAVGRYDSGTYRACTTYQECRAGKKHHENMNQAWDSAKSIFNTIEEIPKMKMECCFTHLCNGSEHTAVVSFFLLVTVILMNLA